MVSHTFPNCLRLKTNQEMRDLDLFGLRGTNLQKKRISMEEIFMSLFEASHDMKQCKIHKNRRIYSVDINILR